MNEYSQSHAHINITTIDAIVTDISRFVSFRSVWVNGREKQETGKLIRFISMCVFEQCTLLAAIENGFITFHKSYKPTKWGCTRESRENANRPNKRKIPLPK